MPGKTAVVLFTRDLRVTDNPALWAASRAERTVPLFVLDEAILGSRFAAPNRVAYMREALLDLDGRLKAMDGRLFLRRGQVVEEAIRWRAIASADELHIAADWSAYARRRERALREACEEARIEFTAHPGVTILDPGAVTPDRRRPLQGLQPLPPGLERGAVARAARRAAQAERALRPRRGRAAGAGVAHRRRRPPPTANRAARPRHASAWRPSSATASPLRRRP